MTDEAFSRLAESVREQIRAEAEAEERERIAQWCDERAKDFEGLPVTEMELTRLAREIRDGAHHEGRE